jgi:Uma2 family endonuclease
VPQAVEPIRGVRERAPTPLRWTRTQCAAIRDAGILTGRYELIDGEVISKMGQKPPHTGVVSLALEWLAGVFGLSQVRVQSTIEVGDADSEHNEPEPDLAVTREPLQAYFKRHPGPDDLVLVIEVAHTTLGFDRTTKAVLYALAGIREYWVIDVKGRALLVHRQPSDEGYAEVTVYLETENAATLARPDATVRVGDLLPPVS